MNVPCDREDCDSQNPVEVAFIILLDQRPEESLGFDFVSLPEPNRVAVLWDLTPGAHFIYIKNNNSRECEGSRLGQFVFVSHSQVLVMTRSQGSHVPFEIIENYHQQDLVDSVLRGYFKGQIARIPREVACLWRQLTSCINEEIICALRPIDRVILSQGKRYKVYGIDPYDDMYTSDDSMDTKAARGDEQIYYTAIPKLSVEGKAPAEITSIYMDTTTTLDTLCNAYKSGNNGYKFQSYANEHLYALAEMQHAFVAFVLCFNFQSFEQYKKLLRLFCNAEKALVTDCEFAKNLILTIKAQLETCDFEREMLGQDIISTCLYNLSEILTDYNIHVDLLKQLADVFQLKFGIELQQVTQIMDL